MRKTINNIYIIFNIKNGLSCIIMRERPLLQEYIEVSEIFI
jgi:hypothetical protein